MIVRLTVGFDEVFGVGLTVGFDEAFGVGFGVEPGITFFASIMTFPVVGSVWTSIQTLLVHCAALAMDPIEKNSQVNTIDIAVRTVRTVRVLVNREVIVLDTSREYEECNSKVAMNSSGVDKR